MRRLRKFLALPSSERRLLLQAALFLGGIRLGLAFLSFGTARRLLARAARRPAGRGNGAISSDRIAWAVTVAGRYVPGARTCLIQALAAHVLLERGGLPARLHLGVTKGEDGRLESHAWVESQERIVIGGTTPGCYASLVAYEGEGR